MPADALFRHHARLGAILTYVPLMFPAVGLGLLLGSALAGLLIPARRGSEQDVRISREKGLSKAARDLARTSGVLLAVALPISLTGVLDFVYITADGIYVNRLATVRTRRYPWAEVREVLAGCAAVGDGLRLRYRVLMADGTEVDLMKESGLRFARAYPKIAPFLFGSPDVVYRREIEPRGVTRLEFRYTARDAGRLLDVLLGDRGLFEEDAERKQQEQAEQQAP